MYYGRLAKDNNDTQRIEKKQELRDCFCFIRIHLYQNPSVKLSIQKTFIGEYSVPDPTRHPRSHNRTISPKNNHH